MMPSPPPRAEVVAASITNCRRMMPLPGPQGLADTDLPGALGDRDQHDVHNADAAHQQRDAGDGRQDGDDRILTMLVMVSSISAMLTTV